MEATLADLEWQTLPFTLREAAKRASDAVNQHLADDGWWAIRNKYIAINIQSGKTDGVLYDTHRDAVRHQLEPKYFYFLSFRNLGAGGAKDKELAIVLNLARKAYDAGMRFTDPDDVNGGQELLLTANRGDYEREQTYNRAARRAMLFNRTIGGRR